MKKLTAIIFFLVVSVSCQIAHAQLKISFGTELGINSSGLPESNFEVGRNYWNSYNSTTKPVVSPVFGIWIKTKFKEHFFINLGAQHYQVGYYYENHTVNFDALYPGHSYNNDEWRHLLTQKLSIPLSVGYDFKIRKMKLGLFVGFSKNYMLNASYYDNERMIKNYHPIENYIEEHFSFPFDKSNYEFASKRWSCNKLIGVNAYVSKKINLSFCYSGIQYFEFGNLYGGDFGYINHFDFREYKLTIKYSFN